MQSIIIRLHKKMRLLSEKGFTLIEIITVILLLGIIGVMGSEVITTSFKGFSETDASMELYEEGKLALMRMEREIHHMVPNAVFVPPSPGDTEIYFGKIDVNAIQTNGLTGQYYHPVGPQLQWIRDEADAELPAPSYISIYNTSWTTFTTNTNPDSSRHVYRVNASNPANHRLTLTNDVGTNKDVISSTSTRRYYPVSLAIHYYIDTTDPANWILRRSQASVSATTNFIANLNAVNGPPLLSHITALSFRYTPASLTRNALVQINFSLTNKGITLDFHKEIQVRNVP